MRKKVKGFDVQNYGESLDRIVLREMSLIAKDTPTGTIRKISESRMNYIRGIVTAAMMADIIDDTEYVNITDMLRRMAFGGRK